MQPGKNLEAAGAAISMESNRPPSPRLSRSRSGAPRLCHVAPPLSPNLAVRPSSRSSSAAKSRPDGGGRDAGGCLRQPFKENRVEAVGGNAKKVVAGVTPSAWALSPGRYPVAEAKGGSGGGGRRRMSGVLGFFRQKKEPSSEKEEAGHKLRVMVVRLMQWRFVNARAEAAMDAKAVAENKIFFSWLKKITELRNIVAAKRILIQRRKQRMRVIKVINPQLNFLNRWDLLAKKHIVAVDSLVKFLEAKCFPVPLDEGAKANLEMVHKHICNSMDLMLAIEAAIKGFYSKAELVKSLLSELVKVVQQEAQCLIELTNTNNLIKSLQMHEISLRSHLIQAKKQEVASIPFYDISIGLSWRHFHPTFSVLY